MAGVICALMVVQYLITFSLVICPTVLGSVGIMAVAGALLYSHVHGIERGLALVLHAARWMVGLGKPSRLKESFGCKKPYTLMRDT